MRVGGPAEARALIHLVKLPGKLTVDTGGVAAEISADGARIGRVPGIVDVPAGDRTLTFRAPRYLDHVERLNIAGGGEKQQLKVALKPNFAVISVSSVPAGAQIEVDGKPAGVTPAKVEMDSGIRRVQLSAPGLRVWTSSVAVNAGVPQTIGPIELGAADARVTVRSVPSGAQVTTGGSFRGVTPADPGARAGCFAFHQHRARRATRRGRAKCSPSPARNRSSTRASPRCWSTCVSRASRPMPRYSSTAPRAGRRRHRCSCRRAGITSRCARKASSPSSPTWCSRRESRARSTSSCSIRATWSAIRRRGSPPSPGSNYSSCRAAPSRQAPIAASRAGVPTKGHTR